MSEQLTKYLADRRKKSENTKIDFNKMKKGSEITEEHHVRSRKNGEDTIILCLPCHNYITNKQNSLSVEQRKNSKIMALKSVLAMQELVCEHFRFIIEKEITDEKQNSDSGLHRRDK